MLLEIFRLGKEIKLNFNVIRRFSGVSSSLRGHFFLGERKIERGGDGNRTRE